MNPVLTTSPNISQQECKNLFAFASVLFSNITAAVVDPSKCSWADLSLFIRGGDSTAEYHQGANFQPALLENIIIRWKNDPNVSKLRVGYPEEWNGDEKSPSGTLEILLELKSSSNFVAQVEDLLRQ
jgi:hypothetical protein